jgi:DNA-binding CsgD family transcriptional regulator
MGRAARTDVVGRAAELAQLGAVLPELRAGRGGTVWIEGEPGIGKSTLIDTLVAEARAALFAVFSGAGGELMEAFPLRLMAECLGTVINSADQARVEIARLLRGEAGAGPFDPVLAASERMLELVDRSCADRPVVLVLEDLHWADESSLLVWNRLARSVDQIPLLLVGTCRPVPGRATVRRLRGVVEDRSGLVIDLGPVDPPAVARIAAGLAGRPGPRLTRELRRAGGNPFYVRELVEALIREGQVELRDGQAELAEAAGETPDSLAATIGSRLRFLTGQTLYALRSAALLGHEFDAHSWEVVEGRSASELAASLEEAIAGGVISPVGVRLRFRHALIREVLVEQTPAAIRSTVHAQFAQALAAEHCELDVVAGQLLAAPQAMDAWALGWLADLSESEIYSALGVSIELLNRALKTLPVRDPRWEVLASRLVLAGYWLGESAGSIASVSRESTVELASRVAGRTGDVQLAARMRVIASRAAGRIERYQDALRFSTLTPADDELPNLWRGRLNAWSSMALFYLGRPAEARLRAKESIHEAQLSRDALSMAYAHFVLGRLATPESSMSHIDAGLAVLGDDPESLELHTQLLRIRLWYARRLGQPGELDATQPLARVAAERTGSYQSASLAIDMAENAVFEGRWEDALQLASATSELAPVAFRAAAHTVAALVAMHREQHQTAEAHLAAAGYPEQPDAAPASQPPVDNSRRSQYFALRDEAFALRAEVQGDLSGALGWRGRWLDQPQPVKDEYAHLAPELVRNALAVGDTATARAALDACEAAAQVFPDGLTAARCCRALLDGDGRRLLALAEEYRSRFRADLLAAKLDELAAVHLAVAGDLTDAKAALNTAVAYYDGLGATWDIRRASAGLRPYGIRRGPRSVHRRATTGWASLTPAEARVARLVALGLSNPDIARELVLSRNTVQTHVSSLLAKLGLRSRIEVGQHIPPQTEDKAGLRHTRSRSR